MRRLRHDRKPRGLQDDNWIVALASTYALVAVTIAVVRHTTALKQISLLVLYSALFAYFYFRREHLRDRFMHAVSWLAVAIVAALVVVYYPTAPNAQFFVIDGTMNMVPVFNQVVPAMRQVADQSLPGKLGVVTFGMSEHDCDGTRTPVALTETQAPGSLFSIGLTDSIPLIGGDGSVATGLEKARELLRPSTGSKSVTVILVRPTKCDTRERMNATIDNWPTPIGVRLYSIGALTTTECAEIQGWVAEFQRRGVKAGHENDTVIADMPARLQAFASRGATYFDHLSSGTNSSC